MPRIFWTATSARVILEALLIYSLLTAALWSISAELGQRSMLQGLFFVSLDAGGWAALRLRMARKGWLTREVPVALLFTLLFTAGAVLALTIPTPDNLALPTLGQILLVTFTGSTYVAARVAFFVWRFWDRLRHRRLLWSLTHAHLLVVLLGAMLMMTLSVFNLFRSTQTYSILAFELHNMSLSTAARVVIGLLLVLSFLALVTFIAILVVIPPSAVFSFLVMRGTVRRLRNLAAATRAVRAKNYAARVRVQGEDEVAGLQTDFNAMAADLEGAIQKLQAERDTVQRLLQMRRDLTANVSHDLRTPLASLRASLESAIDHESPLSLSQLQTMQRDVLHLQRMVDDLFTLSRLDVGQLPLRCEPTDLGPIIRRIAESTASYAWRSRRVEISAEIPDSLPAVVVDSERLDQILRNLIQNSLRHTPSGGIITLNVAQETGAIAVEVWDSGEGIRAEDLPHIWERFYKGKQTNDQDDNRLGLGLAIVKELTEAMHGTIVAESTPGMGTRFVIRLRLAHEGANDRIVTKPSETVTERQ